MPFEACITSLHHFWFQLQLDAQPQCTSSTNNIPRFSASGLSLEPWGFSQLRWVCGGYNTLWSNPYPMEDVGWWIKAPVFSTWSDSSGPPSAWFLRRPWGIETQLFTQVTSLIRNNSFFLFPCLTLPTPLLLLSEIISQWNHLHPGPCLGFCYQRNSN